MSEWMNEWVSEWIEDNLAKDIGKLEDDVMITMKERKVFLLPGEI